MSSLYTLRESLLDHVPQVRDPSMPRWVSPLDGSLNLAALDAYIASEEMGFEGGQLRGGERQQLADALRRLRHMVEPLELERPDVLALVGGSKLLAQGPIGSAHAV